MAQKLLVFLMLFVGVYAVDTPLKLVESNMQDSANSKQDTTTNTSTIPPPNTIKANASTTIPGVFPQIIPSPIMPPKYSQSHKDIIKLEFLISYKALAQNGIITGEKYNISEPIIKKAPLLKIGYICKIDTPINDLIIDDETYAIKYILMHYQDTILECLNKTGVSVRYDGGSQNLIYLQDQVLLNLSARRVVAYFDNRYLILEVLKEMK